MGTSGAYGGSGKKNWKKARDAARKALGGEGDGSAASATPPPQLTARPDFFELLREIGNGLRADDPELRKPGRLPRIPLSQVIAAGAAITGLPFLGSATQGTTRERPVLAGARRTGAALGGGLAVRSGDAIALEQLGLDLTDLESLSPRDQAQRIVDRVFGASSDENEQAFREAATIILLQLLEHPDDSPDYPLLICDAASEVVFNRALVEFQDELLAGHTNDEVRELERQLREFIRNLMRANEDMNPTERLPTPEECSYAVAEVTATAVELLRKLTGGET
jgi:hypothetical protein